MSDNFSASSLPCPNCGELQASDAVFCAHCGARLKTIEPQQDLNFSRLPLLLLLTLPIASLFLALGSCAAIGVVAAGIVRLDGKLAAIGAGALLVIIVLAKLPRFFNR